MGNIHARARRAAASAAVLLLGVALLPAMAGIKRTINLTIGGKGSWTRWRGTAALDLSGKPAARMGLGVDQGRYRLEGDWAPAQFLTGKPVTGGFLSLLQGSPIQAARLVSNGVLSQPSVPSQPVGASFLQAQGQNTSGMTDGQVADALKKSMGMY